MVKKIVSKSIVKYIFLKYGKIKLFLGVWDNTGWNDRIVALEKTT